MIFRFAPLLLLALASCASLPVLRPTGGDPPVMARVEVPQDAFVTFASARNPSLGQAKWTEVWRAYRDACRQEGVNQVLALTQMLLETNWLRFGGTVLARQNNFAGLGVTGGGVSGLSFPDVRTGALAHVQHLKAYGSTEPPSAALVDPRFGYVKRGSAPTLRALTGKWAADPAYGDKLLKLYRMLEALG